MPEYAYISTIGQDSHRFGEPSGDCTIMLGGVAVPSDRPILANSDGDVILHAITNAISGLTGNIILGGIADKLCLEEGIKDSSVYLKKALEDLGDSARVGELLNIPASSVGITATTGEGLTAFGRGEGIQVFVILSFRKKL